MIELSHLCFTVFLVLAVDLYQSWFHQWVSLPIIFFFVIYCGLEIAFLECHLPLSLAIYNSQPSGDTWPLYIPLIPSSIRNLTNWFIGKLNLPNCPIIKRAHPYEDTTEWAGLKNLFSNLEDKLQKDSLKNWSIATPNHELKTVWDLKCYLFNRNNFSNSDEHATEK